MISIENFYWTLYENLLGPAGLDCWYYLPFGTTDKLITHEFMLDRPKHSNHVLFHFDQEPVNESSLGYWYDISSAANNWKLCKILANSERSLEKSKICRDRDMLDWYFFYHGFAANNWFRDAQFSPNVYRPIKIYSSYNHLVDGKRSYRMALLARLAARQLLDYGDVSFHATKEQCLNEISCDRSLLSDASKQIIAKHIVDSSRAPPIILDGTVTGEFSARFGYHEYRLWQNSFFHLVNETVFYEQKLHLTEKIFKPIVAMRPFILAAAPGNLKYLKQYGFQTFDKWIDESYDDIVDNDQRLDAITQIVESLCRLTPGELEDLRHDMKPILAFNKKHFFTTFQNKIVDELVDNFDSCVKIWNNGRLDPNRSLARHYNADQVKKVLKRQFIAGT